MTMSHGALAAPLTAEQQLLLLQQQQAGAASRTEDARLRAEADAARAAADSRARALEQQAEDLRAKAEAILANPKESGARPADFWAERRLSVFRLDPMTSGSVSSEPVADPSLSSPTKPEITGAVPGSRNFAEGRGADEKEAPKPGATPPKAEQKPSGPVFMNYPAALLPVIVRHISTKRIPWVEQYISLATQVQGPVAGGQPTGNGQVSADKPQLDSKLGILDYPSGVLDTANTPALVLRTEPKTDWEKEIKKISEPVGLGGRPWSAVQMHLKATDGEVKKAQGQITNATYGRLSEAEVFDPGNLNETHGRVAVLPDRGEKAKLAGAAIPLDGFLANDIAESGRGTVDVLNDVLSKLKQAQRLLNQAAAERANAPNGGGGGGGGQQQPQTGGGGGGGGAPSANKGGGGGGSAGIVPGPGGAGGDVSRAFAQPDGGDLGAVAGASQFQPTNGPKWEGLDGNKVVPPALRATNAFPSSQTSGTPTQTAANSFIPGNMSPGSPIDRSMFAQNGGGGGDGGGDKPASFGGGSTGGTSGGAFGGDDVGRGIGPSYGGRAGLNDPVKRYEAGPGGGSVSSESSGATVATGADFGIPPALMGQVATGKKIKDGAGKGGLGLMGQVYTLLQAQCGDQTQRSKFESFCSNAGAVAVKAAMAKDEKDTKLAYSEDQRGRAAGDRAPASSSK